jgi:hypothetical protein
MLEDGQATGNVSGQMALAALDLTPNIVETLMQRLMATTAFDDVELPPLTMESIRHARALLGPERRRSPSILDYWQFDLSVGDDSAETIESALDED